ncbi:MAG: EFR1 family ferrodoxin [Clostridia bacterium]|nr:EFR1 family ferrodoxin [Clostridia bacterium]
MKTVLYVFSATGNSLTTAWKLAEGLENCEVRSVVTADPQKVGEADAIGFVFPVYYGNIPYPVRAFVERMRMEGEPYLFAVATCRGHVGAAASRLDALLREKGKHLSWAGMVKLPGNSFLNTPEEDQKSLVAQDSNIRALLNPIRNREEIDLRSGELGETPVDYPGNFRGIMADESCRGCGICAGVCPVGNITIVDGKALVGNNCVTCLACFHWCPIESIYMSKQDLIARRRKYHHPAVAYADIVALNREAE